MIVRLRLRLAVLVLALCAGLFALAAHLHGRLPAVVAGAPPGKAGATNAWTVESVTQGDLGAALKLDAAGRPHVAVLDRHVGEEPYRHPSLVYAHWEGSGAAGAWVTETVDSLGTIYEECSVPGLVLDDAGHPHIAYGGSDVRYAQWTGAAWQIQVLPSSGNALDVALALGADGNPRIAYHRGYCLSGGHYCWSRIEYARWTGSAWAAELIDDSRNAGGPLSLALDVDDHAHISYYGGGLKYAWWTGQAWAHVIVDSDGSPGSSLALDAQGHPHISYAGTGSQYAVWTGSAWSIETVDVAGRPDSCLVLDSAGHAHISYYTGEWDRYGWPRVPGELRYAEHADGGGWSVQTVDAAADVGRFSALTLDGAGNPQIAYTDMTHQALKYAVGRAAPPVTNTPSPTSTPRPSPTYTATPCVDPLTWSIETVDGPRFFEQMGERSLRLDADGRAHVAYGGDRLYYAWQDDASGAGVTRAGLDSGEAGVWRTEVVDASPGAGRQTSLALDASGAPHIAYWTETGLKYAVRTDAGWQIRAVPGGPHPSLALDRAGLPHISYGGGSSAIYYVSWTGSTWVSEIVDNDSFYGAPSSDYRTSLVLDAEDRPHISYGQWASLAVRTDAVRLRYAERVDVEPGMPAGWRTETVRTYFGQHSSLALDSGGNPHIAYDQGQYETSRDSATLYAHRVGGAWQIEGVDDGKYPSLALDGDGVAHISYYLDGVLRYAVRSGATFATESVASGGDVGLYSSLALDAAGNPHISFYDRTRVDLDYATWTGIAWELQNVEDGGDAGQYTTLKLDRAGRSIVSYYEAAQHAMRLAYLNDTSWETRTVEIPGVGPLSALALDVAGRPHLAYYDAASASLCYARWTGSAWPGAGGASAGAWLTQTVVGAFEGGVSLALDAADRPHISYRTPGCGDYGCYPSLGYAHWTGAAWLTETVAIPSSGADAEYSSLALDADGHAHMAYFHDCLCNGRGNVAGSLEYAEWTGSAWRSGTVDYIEPDDSRVWAVGLRPSLALDAAGHPHISYICKRWWYPGYGELAGTYWGPVGYAHWTGTAWEVQHIGGDQISLALDAAGQAHLSYRDYDDALRYASAPEGAWCAQAVEQRQDGGQFPSLALDAAGNPRIGYYDGAVHHLKVAQGAPVPVTPTASPTATAPVTETPTPVRTATPTATARPWGVWLPMVWRE